ncbi:aminotransferase class V-fold PLP-dependent enzyme [Pelagibaculum spongiae]|nr:cysteine desulfurase [Pelagibaculum spongiae]
MSKQSQASILDMPDSSPWRDQFPCFSEDDFPIYFDSAATSQKPLSVIQAMDQVWRSGLANVHRASYRLASKSTEQFESARATVAQFIKAKPEEIIFSKGTTEAINLAAQLLENQFQPGDLIALSVMEHHANLVPWQQLAKRKQLKLCWIELNKNNQLDMQCWQQILEQRPKLVAISHISNAIGSINPIEKIISDAKKINAITLIDAAQSITHLPIDVKKLDCDFLAFSGHKLFGPTGIGALYGRYQLLEQLPPVQFGGEMIRQVCRDYSEFQNPPFRFEPGTPNIAGALGMASAINWLKSQNQPAIEHWQQQLAELCREKLTAIDGVSALTPNTGSIQAFAITGVHTADIAMILDEQNIALRSGHHCAMPLIESLGLAGCLRVSIGPYNTANEINALAEALEQAMELLAE